MKYSMRCLLVSLCFVLSSIEHASARFLGDYRFSLNSEYIRDISEDCANGLHNYTYYPYDCKKYFSCDNGTLEIKTCDDDYYWNDAITACDVKDNVDCSNIRPFPADPDCSDGKNVYFLYPYDCQMFYECLDYNLYLLTCPADTLWNDNAKKCDEDGKTDCSHIIPSPASTPSTVASTTATPTYPYSTTTKQTTPKPPTSKPTTSNPTTLQPIPPKVECTYQHQYYPYPYDCGKYYECSNNEPQLMDCPAGEYWNNVKLTCDFPWNVDCVASTPATPSTPQPTTTTPKPTTTTPRPTPTTPKQTTSKPTTPKVECTYEHQYYPYPYDCSKYYECSNNIPNLMNCPYGEYWNNALSVCDWAANVECDPMPVDSY